MTTELKTYNRRSFSLVCFTFYNKQSPKVLVNLWIWTVVFFNIDTDKKKFLFYWANFFQFFYFLSFMIFSLRIKVTCNPTCISDLSNMSISSTSRSIQYLFNIDKTSSILNRYRIYIVDIADISLTLTSSRLLTSQHQRCLTDIEFTSMKLPIIRWHKHRRHRIVYAV